MSTTPATPDLGPGTQAALGRIVALAWLVRTILRLERRRALTACLVAGLSAVAALALLPEPAGIIVPALAALAAWFGAALALRHTRGAEDDGTAELVRVGVVGPSAPAICTALVLDLTQTALAAAVALGAWGGGALRGLGPAASSAWAGPGWSGALLLGVVTAGIGTATGCLALVIAALCSPARRARLVAAGMGLAAVAVWAIWGPGADGAVSAWLSPLTWAVATGPLGDVTAWPLVLMAAVGDVGAGAAIALWHRRGPRLRLDGGEREFVRTCLERAGRQVVEPGSLDDLLDDPVRLHRDVVHLTAAARLWPSLTVAQCLEVLDGLRGLTAPPVGRRAELAQTWGERAGAGPGSHPGPGSGSGDRASDRGGDSAQRVGASQAEALSARQAGALGADEQARVLEVWALSQDVVARILPAPPGRPSPGLRLHLPQRRGTTPTR